MYPESPPESQRSREFSWSSVYVTPYKAMTAGRNRNRTEAAEQPPVPVFAPSATQRSAKRYCSALLVAAIVTGTFWSVGSPALLVALNGDWKLLALARLAIGVGSALPPPSLFRSVRTYVRFCLDFRVLLWTLVLPALWLTLRSNVLPPVSLRNHASPHTCDTAFVATTLCLLLIDAAAAAVPAAAGFPDGFRLEQQLFGEYSVCAPPRLLKTLQRRMTTSTDIGTLVVAPVLTLGSLILAAECGDACHPYSAYLLPASLAAAIAFFSLIAAAIITAGGRPARSVVPCGPLVANSPPVPPMTLEGGTPPRAQAPAAAPAAAAPVNPNDVNFTPNVRRTLSLPPIPASDSEAALADAVHANVAALAASRAAAVFGSVRGRIYHSRPALALSAHCRKCWRLRGLLARSCLLATALVIEDAVATVALPLLCVIYLRMPQTPDPLLWSAVCTCVAIGAMRVGRLTIAACASRYFPFNSAANRDSNRFLSAVSPEASPQQPRSPQQQPRSPQQPPCRPLDMGNINGPSAHDRMDDGMCTISLSPGGNGGGGGGHSLSHGTAHNHASSTTTRACTPNRQQPNTPSRSRSNNNNNVISPLREHTPSRTNIPLTPPPAAASLADCRIPLNGNHDNNNNNYNNNNGGLSPLAEARQRGDGISIRAPASGAGSAPRRGLFHHTHDNNDDITVATQTAYVQTVAPTASGALPMPSASFFSAAIVGGCCALLGTALAVLAAAATLPAAYELTLALPEVLPVQPQIILFVSCFLLGGFLALGCGALHARLGYIDEAVSAARLSLCATPNPGNSNVCAIDDAHRTPHPNGGMAGGCAVNTPANCNVPCSNGGSPRRPDWLEVVDSLRSLGAIVAQPSLCAALGLLPTRTALWGFAGVAGLAVVASAAAALAMRCRARPLTRKSRRQRLLNSGTPSAETPDTLLLSSPEEEFESSAGDCSRGDCTSDGVSTGRPSGYTGPNPTSESTSEEHTE